MWLGVTSFFTIQVLTAQDSQLRVSVVDPLHRSVRRGRIDLLGERASRSAFTDEEGTASFTHPSSGKYKVRVSASGFRMWSRNQELTADQEKSLLVTVQPGSWAVSPISRSNIASRALRFKA